MTNTTDPAKLRLVLEPEAGLVKIPANTLKVGSTIDVHWTSGHPKPPQSKVGYILSWNCARCQTPCMMLTNEGGKIEAPFCGNCGAPGPTHDALGQPIPVGEIA